MFRIKLAAYETYRNATRPLIYASLQGVLETFNLNHNVRTYFNDEAEASRMIGTTFSRDVRTDQETDIGFEERQYIEVEIEDAEVNTEMDASHRHLMNAPMWIEPVTQSYISPLYETKKVNVTINRYFPDKVLAERFKTQIKSGLKGQPVQQFSAAIHYPLINSVLECMETIYTRLVNAGVVDSSVGNAFEWFKSNCTVPCDVIMNKIGNNPAFVFKRALDSIKLRFDGIDIAKTVSKGKYNGQYLVSFSYSFYYPELTEWELSYPIIVYQQMTDPRWIPEIKQEFVNDYPTSQFFEGSAAFNSERYMSWSSPDLFVFPPEDNFRVPPGRKLDDKLQRLAIMDNVDDQVILNLFTFAGKETFWNENFKTYLKFYHDKVTHHHKNPLYVTVWSDDIQVLDSQISMDENGDIRINRKPNMGKAYRVVLFFDYDVANYDWDGITDLVNCENETMSRWILGILFPYLPLPGDKEYTGYTKEGSCPWIDWDYDIIDKLVPSTDGGGTNSDGSGKGGGGDNKDYVSVPMMDMTIIAKNNLSIRDQKSTLLDFNATQYLRRK